MDNQRENKSILKFDKWSDSYDSGPMSYYFHAAYKKVYMLICRSINEKDIIADIGCGTGEMTLMLSELVPKGKVIGCDISPKMINVAKEKKARYKASNIAFKVLKYEKLLNQLENYDWVICMNAFHHFSNHSDFFFMMNKILKNEGRVLILDLVKDNCFRKLWVYISMVVFREKEVEYHSSEEIRNYFYQAGFDIEWDEYYLYFLKIIIAKKIHKLP